MTEKRELFRKEALKELSSPEQLDQILKIVRPPHWAALAGVFILLGAAIYWGIVGKVATRVTGPCILMRSGGIFQVVAKGSGQVTRVSPRTGDTVVKGEVLVNLELPELFNELESKRLYVEGLETEAQLSKSSSLRDSELRLSAISSERETLRSQIETVHKQLTFLNDKVASQEKLLRSGLITKQQLFETQHQTELANTEVEGHQTKLEQLQTEEFNIRETLNKTEREQSQALETARKELADLENTWSSLSNIRSPYSGRVVEIIRRPGNLVSTGEAVLTIETAGNKLEAAVYLPPQYGKRVKPGMPLFVSPSTVRSEEHGMMIAMVDEVSEYPSSLEAMTAMLGNQAIATSFSSNGPPIAVLGRLQIDYYTESGYAWTSGSGPPVTVSGGTLCQATVTVDEQAPVELIIPGIRALLSVFTPGQLRHMES